MAGTAVEDAPRLLVPDYPHRVEHLWRRVGTRKLYPGYAATVPLDAVERLRLWRHYGRIAR